VDGKLQPTVPFAIGEWHGEVVHRFALQELEGEVLRLVDPAAAEETIHWGRNYLYRTHLETPEGSLPVVVKQVKTEGLKARWRKRQGGSKALRSWRMARAFEAAGIPTAEAVMLIEPVAEEGPSFFVSRFLEGVVEARYLLRAIGAGREAEEFPEVDVDTFIGAMGKALHRMHEAQFFHRDLSIGNVLFRENRPGRSVGIDDLYIIDLNRARRRRPGLIDRTRDLCRLAIFRPAHRRRFLTAYWGDPPGWLRTFLFHCFHHGFYLKIESKKTLRALTRRFVGWLKPRRAHAHIPAVNPEAAARDKIVWDYLSDQPHQHAGRFEKLSVRLRDAPSHLRYAASFLAAAPRVWQRYRQLTTSLYREPVSWNGVGICVRPYPPAPEKVLEALDELGIRKVLLRLHPWDSDHSAEEELAAELHRRGYELAFSLPQNRDLVRDPGRWRAQIEELAEKFTPFGRHFQVGQAINRSKWGVWRYGEYLELAAVASEILRRYPETEVMGPAVIDFEVHVTAAVLNLPGTVHFDVLASLLYVDRRGAPENRQLGFDTVGKIALLQAIAETAKSCGPRSWITEVNWPLWEGPHSPAGRSVSVSEPQQADYLARFYLLALGTGLVERVYWWQLVARGYGLMTAEEDPRSLRKRPAFATLRTLESQLKGSQFMGPLPTEDPGTRLGLFRWSDGRECIVGWSLEGSRRARLPKPASQITERDGKNYSIALSQNVDLLSSVRYFHL
jgi:hypothetical protein